MLESNVHRRFAIRLLFVAMAVSRTTMVAAADKANDADYSVGVAKIDVTPSYPIRLNGFGFRRVESEGVTQPIFAKAVAIGSDAERPLILVTLDSTGIRLTMVDEVAARLKEKAGIERDRFAVTFTHTHTAPKVNGVCDTVFSSPIPAEHLAKIDRYTQELADAIEQVALAALKDRRPAKLSWAKGTVGFAKNRRTPGGPVDHDLPMLVVKSAEDGSIRGIYVSYACHCVTLSENKISGDWAGFAQAAIERNHPGAVALVSIGCGSDSNPDSGVTGANYAVAAEQGGQIAAEVERLLGGLLQTISGPIEATMSRIDLPLNELPGRTELEKLAANDDPAGYNAKYQLAKLDRGETLATKIEYPIQTWNVGDALTMIFLGGEVCVDYSLRLKQELDPTRVWIHGYANEMCSYIPSERLAREGGYGGGTETVYFALPATLRAGLEDKIISEVHRQVPDRFRGKGAAEKSSAMQSLSPAESLATIHVGDDLTVELMAAEPLVVDPVAIDFGPDGRLWVAEMRDYSRGVDEKFEQTGQITVLANVDGDDRLDTSTAFATGLRFPTDVKAWRNGVIVCDAPDVIYMEDTDGDGRADVKRTLLTGFATHNAQARVNSLRWGLDGWLYGSCGLFGGSIRSQSGKVLELGSRDFRFQPESGKIEAVTGRTQQGRARDDWQSWFGCENGSLLNHYPLTDHYLARNPHVAPPADEVFVPSEADANQLYPLGKLVLFKESGPPGRPTSACGLEIYRDELLGAAYRGNAFIAEPVNQLVRRLVLRPRGVTFAGLSAEGETRREFLASTDQWFRPVQVRTGPDGCLWIVDMHRLVIEHPRFIPQETLRKIDVMAGHTTGRIFRVRPRGQSPRPWIKLDQLDVPSLVAALDSSNGPQRDMVQQILMQRVAREARTALEKLLTSDRAEVRLQALYSLSGLGVLRASVVCQALHDSHAAVRRHAVQLSEPFLAANAEVAAAVLKLVDDADANVQMQLAYSLGEWSDSRGSAALARLAIAQADDPYIFSASLSSANRENTAVIAREIISQTEQQSMPAPLVDGLIILVSKFGDAATLGETFAAFIRADSGVVPTWRVKAAADLMRALDDDKRRALLGAAATRDGVDRLVATAQSLVRDPKTEESALKAALQIVIGAAGGEEIRRETIAQLLSPQNPPTVQLAAVDAVATANFAWAADTLLQNWGRYTPDVRDRILAYFFERETLLPALLSAIQSGAVKVNDLDALERQQLLTHGSRGIRELASAVLAGAINVDRAKVIAGYAEVRELAGDVARGRALFGKHCSSCHKMEGQGHAVGPDLAAVTSRSISSLLESLLDPNRAIDERYQSYTVTTDEGLVHTGILLGENATSVTLLEQQGTKRVLLRRELDDLVNTQISLMPEGFERDLSRQDVADLLAYLSANGVPPKQVAGNRPEVVEPDAAGVFRLLASKGAIYGQDIIFEQPLQNIGYWHDEADYVAWKVSAPLGGTFDVYLYWACADDSSGNGVLVEGFEQPIRFIVPGTGGYDEYQTLKIGTADVARGEQQIVVRADGTMARPNLMDLRGLYLVPTGTAFDVDSAVSATNQRPSGEPNDAAVAIEVLLDGLAVGTPHEYERIPAIWQAAIAAGRRNDAKELQRVLALAVPKPGQPLDHWRAVVLGGGIVNGISQQDVWPRQRLAELLQTDKELQDRWARVIDLSAAMADDEALPTGTRYDALRMLGVDDFDRRGKQIAKYLASDVHAELQMGAVSGLADMDSPAATEALINNFNGLRPANQELAVSGLMRSDERISALMRAIDVGKIQRSKLTPVQIEKLKSVKSQALRAEAALPLKPEK